MELKQSQETSTLSNGWNDPPFLKPSTYISNASRSPNLLASRTGYKLNQRLVHPEVSSVNTTKRTELPHIHPAKHIILSESNQTMLYTDTQTNTDYIFETLHSRLFSLPDTSISKIEREEINKKLQICKSEWTKTQEECNGTPHMGNGVLSNDIKHKMYNLVTALSNDKFDEAFKYHSDLIMQYPLQINNWLIGIKKLMTHLHDDWKVGQKQQIPMVVAPNVLLETTAVQNPMPLPCILQSHNSDNNNMMT